MASSAGRELVAARELRASSASRKRTAQDLRYEQWTPFWHGVVSSQICIERIWAHFGGKHADEETAPAVAASGFG